MGFYFSSSAEVSFEPLAQRVVFGIQKTGSQALTPESLFVCFVLTRRNRTVGAGTEKAEEYKWSGSEWESMQKR